MADSDYISIQKKMVMYPHLNSGKRLFGGMMVAWIDECSAIFAKERMHSDNLATKVINTIVFNHPIELNDIVDIQCAVAKKGHTSLTVKCRVMVKAFASSELQEKCSCELVFVNLTKNGKPLAWNHSNGRGTTY